MWLLCRDVILDSAWGRFTTRRCRILVIAGWEGGRLSVIQGLDSSTFFKLYDVMTSFHIYFDHCISCTATKPANCQPA